MCGLHHIAYVFHLVQHYKITEFLSGEVTLANIGFDAKCLPGQYLEKIKIFEVTQYIYMYMGWLQK